MRKAGHAGAWLICTAGCVQVEAVMQSVASHRASVPAVISKALEQQLQAVRPPGAEDDVAGPTGVLQIQGVVL
jgi:hypothetical protein